MRTLQSIQADLETIRMQLAEARTKVCDLELLLVKTERLATTVTALADPRVQRLLLHIPADGSWMPASGPCADILNDLLDEGTLFVEEDVSDESDDAPWRVRLTAETLEALASNNEREHLKTVFYVSPPRH